MPNEAPVTWRMRWTAAPPVEAGAPSRRARTTPTPSQILTFTTAEAWEGWLDRYHD